jgi:hypothetical protein
VEKSTATFLLPLSPVGENPISGIILPILGLISQPGKTSHVLLVPAFPDGL